MLEMAMIALKLLEARELLRFIGVEFQMHLMEEE